MQDLKEMGGPFEVRMGNREVALLVGALFLVLVLAFSMGVMVGKRMYGPDSGQIATNQAQPGVDQPSDPNEPPKIKTDPPDDPVKVTYPSELKNDSEEPSTETPSDTVTEPEPAVEPEPEPPPKTVPKKPTGKHTIQIMALVDKRAAQKAVNTLKSKGLDAWMSTKRSERGTFYLIRVGHYPNKDAAHNHLLDLKADGLIPGDAYVL